VTDFVHLHLHTEYSLLDGLVRLNKIAGKNGDDNIYQNPLKEALKKHGMDAAAITDHGNMYGVYNFVKSFKGSGIKPIIGCEVYITDDMFDKRPEVLRQRDHLILLCKNDTGYQNLMKICSAGFVDGFYQKPRVDLNLIEKYSEGLICLSACLAGRIPRYLLLNDYDAAKAYAERLKGIFESGDFYIELQDHNLPEEKHILPKLVRLAREIGVKVVATNDVHYINREDADLQDTMMCVQMQCKKTEHSTARFENDSFYLKSGDEMAQLFDWCPEAISTTREIAEKCNVNFVLERPSIIPKFTNEEMGDRDEAQYLKDLAWEGLKKRYDDITDEIKQRLEYELEVIIDCGYAGYFLIVWDFVNEAKKNGIPVGPGRGSGVGSLVAYSIGITDVDPLKYNLFFERFLSKERVSMPDFDIDFCFVRRGEIINYVTKKYGAENVAQIIAYSTMNAKAAIKDVARVFDIPFAEANLWVKDLPNKKLSIPEYLGEWGKNAVPEFIKLYNENPEAKKVIDIAKNLEGMPRQVSIHAAGVVICPEPIVKFVPLQRNGDEITTQFDKDQIEKLGLLKMDFLGLKTLTDINEALKYIKADKGVDIDFHKLGYEDPEVYKLISSGDCEGVFQLESGGMRKFMSQLKPDNFEDIIAGIALYRPGPMDYIGDFIEGKRNPDKVEYLYPTLKDILGVTYGCIVYQEQVMHIARSLAGYTFGGADILRRAIAKKKIELLNENKKIFIDGGVMQCGKMTVNVPGCVANGVPREIAEEIFARIYKFANYAFNKAHAAAYAVLSYQTAYLKRYYPLHFILAVINNRISNADEVKHYLAHLREKGFTVYPPDINKSEELFTIENDNIRFGLMGIKNMGEAAMKSIVEERKANGPYTSLRDFIERNPLINKRMIESLILGGAFDCFGHNRATLMASYERIADAVNADRKSSGGMQLSLFSAGLVSDVEIKYTVVNEFERMKKLNLEKEVLGMYVSGHPLDGMSAAGKNFNFKTNELYVEEENEDGDTVLVPDKNLNGKRVRVGGIITSVEKKLSQKGTYFAVGKFEDEYGAISFALFGNNYTKCADALTTEAPVCVTGRLDTMDEREPKIIVESVEPWESAKDSAPKDDSKDDGREEVVCILADSKSTFDILKAVLSHFPGSTRVRVQMKTDSGYKLFEMPRRVDYCDELKIRVTNIVGESNVKIVRLQKK